MSLRKQKTKELVSAKRAKMLDDLHKREQSFEIRQICLDRTNPDYTGYYKFREDVNVMPELVKAIAPTFYSQTTPVSGEFYQ